MGTYQFFMKLDNPMDAGGWIRVIVPPEVSLQGGGTSSFTALVSIAQSATITTSTQTLNGVSRQVIDIKNGIQSYIGEGGGILFSLGGIKNPASSKPTSSFEFYTFDSLGSGIDKLTQGLTITA